MTTIPRFKALLAQKASDTRYRRVDSLVACPCRTPEGMRDPEWHFNNMGAEICNEAGFLADPAQTVDVIVKAFVQPIQSTRATRLTTEQVLVFFGEIQTDDHLGIFPYDWEGTTLDFRNWGRSGEDFIEYAEQRFFVVNANLIPDPDDGNPYHHWEVALRLISKEPTL
jgi:hypothetical protein